MTLAVYVAGDLGSAQIITVPAGVDSLEAFVSAGTYTDGIGADRPIQAALWSNLSWNSWGALTGGYRDLGLIAVSDRNFPAIPLIPGERLMVALSSTGSAILYFHQADV